MSQWRSQGGAGVDWVENHPTRRIFLKIALNKIYHQFLKLQSLNENFINRTSKKIL